MSSENVKRSGYFLLVWTMAALVLAALMSPQYAAAADPYPVKPVTIKVPFPAGGGVDGIVRQLLATLQGSLGQPVIVENLPGVGGALGTMNVGRSPSDGYTLLAHGNDLVLAPLVLAAAQYKSEDFRLITPLVRSEYVLLARPGLAGKSLKELVEISKSSPGGLSVAHQGLGSLSHLVTEDLQSFSGMRITGVPYKGGAPIIQDLLGNHVDLSFLPVAANSIAMIKERKLAGVGIAGLQRNPEIPDVPILGEGRTDRTFEHTSWIVLMAKRDVPEAVAEKLNLVVRKALDTPDFHKFTKESGSKPFGMSLKEAGAFYSTAQTHYSDMAKRFNLTPQ